MSNQSEDNLIDQSLRDVFRDYDLPPDAHPRVWEGVAERIAALPPPSQGLSYRFLLPLTAMIGASMGWLLPHPAAQPATELAVPVRQAMQYAPMVRTAPVPAPLLPALAAPAPEAQPVRQLAEPARPASRKQWVAAPTRPAPAPQPSATPPAADSTGLVAQTAVVPAVVAPADSAPATVPAPVLTEPTATPPSAAAPQVAPTAKSAKPVGSSEKIGYRKLTQRQPEGRRGIGRWFTRFFHGVRHLLG